MTPAKTPSKVERVPELVLAYNQKTIIVIVEPTSNNWFKQIQWSIAKHCAKLLEFSWTQGGEIIGTRGSQGHYWLTRASGSSWTLYWLLLNLYGIKVGLVNVVTVLWQSDQDLSWVHELAFWSLLMGNFSQSHSVRMCPPGATQNR